MALIPDPEALLIAALKARAEVSAFVGARVGTRLSGTYPAIRVTLVGGAERPTVNTGVPDLQVECWGNGSDSAAEGQACDLARAVESVIPDLRGVYGSGFIVAATVAGYIVHSPDSSSGRERYLMTCSLVMQ